MNLLQSEGHIFAPFYSVARVWSEAKMSRKLFGERIATEATVQLQTIAAAISGKTRKLDETLKKVRHGD